MPPRPGEASASASRTGETRSTAETRPARLVEREAPFLRAELRRVAAVTGVSSALLASLVVIDRLG
ncbi:MAG TPA: hypothetical protein QGI71_00200 [Dehalococcoidia bacterium]|nr:hypothetical protein [Dehalococcoidia bacterium]